MGAATTVAIGAANTGTALFSTATVTGAAFPSTALAEVFSTAASVALSAVGSAVGAAVVVLSSACLSSASNQIIYKSIG